MVISATSPGLPATGTITGDQPSRAATTSRSASVMMRAMTPGLITSDEAIPSVNGHWETTAAIPGTRAAVAITCPPANEVPHNAIRSGSTPATVRA
ncbi:hypothetical protein C1Y40_05201 [Mycobacterium talmoniae]|uniref:Uncharacterized protein n=1 Tax=Mycobacterium talmoniae TaxID=1858794 RepID=A0A2S8BD99_9MYCO|nr:hypothetical protein C1Y40_05201 [Mycobacterium talmoniae]